MSDPHCVLLLQGLAPTSVGPLLCTLGEEKPASIWNSSLAAPSVALLTAALGWFVNALLQRNAEVRSRDQIEHAARATAFAELWRLWRETRFAWEFVNKDVQLTDGMIWVPVFRSVFPNKDNLARIAPLTAREVSAITSVYYVYQEAIVFIKASALWVLPLTEPQATGADKRKPPTLTLDEDAIEYVYRGDSDERDVGRRGEVLRWLAIIDEQARKALVQIESAERKRFPGSDLALFIKSKRKTAAGFEPLVAPAEATPVRVARPVEGSEAPRAVADGDRPA